MNSPLIVNKLQFKGDDTVADRHDVCIPVTISHSAKVVCGLKGVLNAPEVSVGFGVTSPLLFVLQKHAT